MKTRTLLTLCLFVLLFGGWVNTAQAIAPPVATTASGHGTTSFNANWESVPLSTAYLLDVATDAAFTSLVGGYSNLDVGNVLTYPVTGLTENTHYYYRVRSYDGGVSLNSNTIETYTLPTPPTMSTPVSGVFSIPLSANLEWVAKAAPVDVYYVELREGSTSGTVVFEGNVGGVTSYHPTVLEYNKTYFWRIQAHNTTNFGPYSAFESFTTALDVPTLLTPPDLSTVSDLTPSFTWSGPTGADRWDFRLYSNVGLTTLIDEALDLSSASYTTGVTLTAGTQYWWVVRGRTNSTLNQGVFSSPFTFTTLANPGAFDLTSPVNAAFNIPTTNIAFDWDNSSNGTLTYTFELSDNNFGTTLFSAPGLLSSDYTYSGAALSNYTPEYSWRVTAYNEVGNTVSTSTFTFITYLGTPVLTAPINAATGQSLKPSMDWDDVPNADDYLLQVSTMSDFSGGFVYNANVGAAPPIIIGNLLDNQTYYWRVKALKAGGFESLFSSTFSFSTEQSSTTFPANNAYNVPLAFTFTWPATTGADRYHLEVSTNVGFIGPLFIDDNTLTTNSYIASGLAYNSVYFWRVTGRSLTSAVSEFRTMLDVPSITAPLAGVTVLTLTPTFTWTGPDGADRWDLRIYSNSDMTTLVDSVDDLTSATHTTGVTLTRNTPYWWKVRGRTDATGNQGNFASSDFITLDTATTPVITAPVNSSYGIGINPTATWNASTGLGGITYTLQVSPDAIFTPGTLQQFNSGIAGTSFVVSNTLSYYTNYWMRVSAQNPAGTSAWATAVMFRTLLAPVTLLYPANASTGHPLTPTLTWDTLANADEYNVQVDNNSDFSSPEFETTTTNTYADVTGLTDNITYYWRVRGVEDIGAQSLTLYPGTWSPSRTFTVVAGTVPTPYLAWPVGNPTVYLASQQLSWYLGTTGTGITYYVQYSTDSDFLVDVTVIETANTTTNASNLSASTTYYWRVKAYSTTLGIYGAFTATESFVTDASIGPVTPTPVYPTGGTTVYTSGPTLYWSTGAAPSGLTYDVEYNTTGIFTGTPTLTGLTGTSTTLSGLTGGATYHWKVRSFLTGQGTSAWSSEATFVVDGGVGGGPIVPIPSYPIGGTTVYTTTPSLNWYLGAVGTGLTYDVEIQLLATPFTGTPTITGLTSLSYTTAALTAGEEYHWQVRSVSGITPSAWSVAAEFEVDGGSGGGGGSPSAPIPSYPIGGGTVYTVAPSVYWYLGTYMTGLTFKVHYGTVEGGPYPFETVATSDFYTPLSGLLTGTTYYYVVEAIGSGSTFSDEESFVVAGGTGTPSVPNLNWPVGGTTIYLTTQSLYWWMNTTVGVVSYRVLVSTNPDLSDSTVYTSASFSVELTGLTPGETYYWAAQSFDGTNYSPLSATESFSVDGGDMPVRPIVGGPSGNMIIGTTSPSLTWFLPVNQTGQTYEVEYSRNADFSNSVKIENVTSFNQNVQNLLSGVNYYWRVRSIKNGSYSNYSYRGKFMPFDGTTSVGDEDIIPEKFTVNQNYPNPFNPSTTIRFGIPEASMVTIKIYNMLGQEIKTLLNAERNAGTYRVTWNGDNDLGNKVTSGTYIYRVIAGTNVQTMKMIFLK